MGWMGVRSNLKKLQDLASRFSGSSQYGHIKKDSLQKSHDSAFLLRGSWQYGHVAAVI
jgi:hypothetical protein